MENEELIREKMEDTRTSMTEKIEQLEQKVTQTVTGTTEAVTDTVEAVKETVKGTTEAVTETVEKVKETVQETVNTVTSGIQNGLKSVQNLFTVNKHPWFCVGTSVVVGFVAGKILSPARRSRPEVQAMAAATHPIGEAASSPVRTSQVSHSNGGHRTRSSSGQSEKASRNGGLTQGIFQGLASQISPELNKLKSMAIGMLVNMSRDFLMQAVPQQYRGQFQGIFQGLADKITGGPSQEGGHQDLENDRESQEEVSRHPDLERSGHRSSGRRGKFDR